MSEHRDYQNYWKSNLKLLTILLGIWFLISCVLSIFAVEPLNQFRLGGVPLGMWIAQQGSTVLFIILIFIYCRKMDSIDRQYSVNEEE